MRELLQEVSRATFGDRGCSVDDHILLKSHRVRPRTHERECHPTIAAHVPDLLLFQHVSEDEFIVPYTNPDHRHLWAPVPVQGREVDEGTVRDDVADRLWDLQGALPTVDRCMLSIRVYELSWSGASPSRAVVFEGPSRFG